MQIRAFNESNSRINIFEGPVRAGKTFISLIRFIEYCINGPHGEFLVTGRSLGTLKRNFIIPMMELLGNDFVYYEGKREANIYGRHIYVMGANDERVTGKIQGATFAGAWVDEATLVPETFFKMLLSRLSVPGAKLFATTNPDSPYHWLKRDYIDRANELDLADFQFTIDDNPSLTDAYKENLKKEYRGLWYKRYILGEWCLAEDAIYDFFDEDLHVIEKAPTYPKYYILGIDYGTSNPFAALLIGYNGEHHPAIWVEKEYFWDSKKMGRQKTDAEYCADIQNHFGAYPIRCVYVDPSALSFRVELTRSRLPVMETKNDVLDGIRFVGSLLSQGDLAICRNCNNLTKEIQGYMWDVNSITKGEDSPLKRDDHACDALRYAIYSHFGNLSTIKQNPSIETPDYFGFSRSRFS